MFCEKRHFHLAARGVKPGTSRGRRYCLGPQKTNKNRVKTNANATLGPHAPQVGPKIPQVRIKMTQDGPKMVPRSPKMAPRWPQEPKMNPRCTKTGPRRPQLGAPEHRKWCSRLGAVRFLLNWPSFVCSLCFLSSPVLSKPNLASRWP